MDIGPTPDQTRMAAWMLIPCADAGQPRGTSGDGAAPSAVYGSDAVTGVGQFILDKKFEGLKIDAPMPASPPMAMAPALKFGRGFSARNFVRPAVGNF